MEIFKGIVIDKYIPENKDVDYYNNMMLGFKVNIDDKVVTLEEEQNASNIKILVGDKVNIIKQVIDNKEFIDIESDAE